MWCKVSILASQNSSVRVGICSFGERYLAYSVKPPSSHIVQANSGVRVWVCLFGGGCWCVM